MSYAIVYTSLTGNTARLAQALRDALPAGACLYFGAPDVTALAADTIYAGFWTDKGTCDKPMETFLRSLTDQKVFLFGTAGFGGAPAYFNQILARVRAHRAPGVPGPAGKKWQPGAPGARNDRAVAPGEVCGPARRGIKVVFSGDTAPCPALERAARDADLLICDATYDAEDLAPEAAKYGHSTFRQTAALAARAGARRLWLAHYSPRIEDPEAALPLAQAAFPAAECGFDGKAVTLRFTES